MDELAERVRMELRSLRKGYGATAAVLDGRRLPQLWELATGASGVGGTEARGLVAEISGCAATLADDLRIAIMAALGLSTETRHMSRLTDRVYWLGGHLGRSYRAALRRVDLAERLLAAEIAQELHRRRGRAVGTSHGWHLDELRTVLRLDTPAPEAHEHRRIVATRDNLREVMIWLDVPHAFDMSRPRLQAELIYGGQLIRREQPYRGRYQFVVRLPVPLRTGDTHEYGLLLRVPDGELMRPHYVLTPECACSLFNLRVRFPADRAPRWVRRVEGEPVRVFDAAECRDDLLVPDEAGEVSVQFRDPTLYLGYGVQWKW